MYHDIFFLFSLVFKLKKILETTYDNITNPFTMVGWGLQISGFNGRTFFDSGLQIR